MTWRLIYLAWRDLWHESRLTLCNVLALSAIITPLLILFSLKEGLLDGMRDRLLSDPLTMEIIPLGSGRYDDAFFDRVGQWEEIGFLIPKTRSIATSIVAQAGDDRARASVAASLVPTKAGDPLLETVDIPQPAPGEAVVSAEIARALAISAGDELMVLVRRMRDNRAEATRQPLNVSAVAPDHIYDEAAIWTGFDFLYLVEQYRDGYGVAEFGVEGKPRTETPFPYLSFRMYARELAYVSTVRDRLRAEGVQVHTQADRIATFLSLGRNLGLLFWLIAAVAALGFVFALGASLWAGVERKTPTFSLLRLMGVRPWRLVGFPTGQALFLTTAAFSLSLVVYSGVASIINGIHENDWNGGDICDLATGEALAGLGVALVVSLISSSLAARSVLTIEPTIGLSIAT